MKFDDMLKKDKEELDKTPPGGPGGPPEPAEDSEAKPEVLPSVSDLDLDPVKEIVAEYETKLKQLQN